MKYTHHQLFCPRKTCFNLAKLIRIGTKPWLCVMIYDDRTHWWQPVTLFGLVSWNKGCQLKNVPLYFYFYGGGAYFFNFFELPLLSEIQATVACPVGTFLSRHPLYLLFQKNTERFVCDLLVGCKFLSVKNVIFRNLSVLKLTRHCLEL